MTERRNDDSTRERLKEIQRGYVYATRGLLLAIVILTTFQVFSYMLLRDQQDDIIRIERDNYEASKAAKMQTCKDLNELRRSARFVLNDISQNPPLGGERQDRRERFQGFIERFNEVDCKKRVDSLFGEPPR